MCPLSYTIPHCESSLKKEKKKKYPSLAPLIPINSSPHIKNFTPILVEFTLIRFLLFIHTHSCLTHYNFFFCRTIHLFISSSPLTWLSKAICPPLILRKGSRSRNNWSFILKRLQKTLRTGQRGTAIRK